MSSYILTWNPKKWPWDNNDYEREVRETHNGKLFSSQWSCGKTKRILPSDRVYLLRQESDRGIIGSGYAISDVFEAEHWDESKKDETALYVKYQSDTLLPVGQRLPIEKLLAADLGVKWLTSEYMPSQRYGIRHDDGTSTPYTYRTKAEAENLIKENLPGIF